MRKLLLMTATLLALVSYTLSPVAAACMTEQQVIDGAAEKGFAEYRRGGPVSTSPDGDAADLAIAFLDKNGDGVGVWFRGGCVAGVEEADKDGADDFFEQAVMRGDPA